MKIRGFAMNTEQTEAPATAKCEHKFMHFETIRHNQYAGYSTHYTRVDRFYCERCLHEEEKRRETYSRDVPEWYHK